MVNLAPAQRAVEALMTDTVRLRRNPGGNDDDVLNPNPGNLTLDAGAVEPYYDGPATIRVSQAAENGVAGSMASVPLAVIPDEDDVIEVVTSRDPTLPGRWFRVDQVRGGTFAISRRLVISEVAPWPST